HEFYRCADGQTCAERYHDARYRASAKSKVPKAMIRFTVLGSGSSGNALLISTDTTNVLVDAGLSAREKMKRLADVGVEYESLDAIVITHEHSDHIGGLRMLLQKVDCPVYISRETEDAYYWTRKTNGNGESEGTKRRECLKERAVEIESNR